MKIASIASTQFKEVLSKLMAAPLPLKIAYKLHNIDKVAREELEKYEKLRLQALQTFGKRKEDGSLDADEKGNVSFEEGKHQEFMEQLTELLNVEFDHAKIKLEELGDKVELTANEIAIIAPILDL